MSEVVTPIMRWDDERPFTDEVVWWTRLDDRYLVEVRRVLGYAGRLYMFDRIENDRLVHSEGVSLSYGARFGPDAGDVAYWQEIALGVADGVAAEGSTMEP